ncbi:unnamed protein product [Penicillium roqueforti FM164]|uniref:Genomic scaffold, ProqFM164S01 n=1 Tax=Penicillium roqueforti (strain FM164) TaxID=1365484 RepID=W6Q083_PENRF|nr:unnamed protein product [Penicillium roqueforti FM164]
MSFITSFHPISILFISPLLSIFVILSSSSSHSFTTLSIFCFISFVFLIALILLIHSTVYSSGSQAKIMSLSLTFRSTYSSMSSISSGSKRWSLFRHTSQIFSYSHVLPKNR